MSALIKYLIEKKIIQQNQSTIMEETDGCAKQYRCASAINLLSMLSMKYNIVIDRAVGAPGHGKDVVDGLNAVDKRYLKQCMFRLLHPEQKRCEN